MTSIFFEKLKNLVKFLIILFMLMSLANFSIELLLSARAYFTKGNINYHDEMLKKINKSEDADLLFLEQHKNDILDGYRKTTFSIPTGVKRNFSDAVSFNGSSDGRRITSEKLINNKEHSGIIIGASQSWGYFVKDEETISHRLMKNLDGVAIDNYSLLGVTLEQSFQYWKYNKSSLINQKFIIVVGGVYDISLYCNVEPFNFHIKNSNETELSNIGLINFYSRLKRKLKTNTKPSYVNTICYEYKQAEAAINRVISAVELFISEAKKYNLAILIVIPPVTFYGSPNLTELSLNEHFLENQKYLSFAYKLLDKKLGEINSPDIINLMQSFNDAESYYLDVDSHFNKKGHEKIANEILKNIPNDFFN